MLVSQKKQNASQSPMVRGALKATTGFTPACSVALALMIAAAPGAVLANPTGGSVASGSATINTVGNTMTVNQTTQKAVINWDDFSINTGERALFKNAPYGGSSVTLNRVTSGKVSSLQGFLKSDGSIFIVNKNGIVVGKNAVLDIGRHLVMTTNDIDDNDFNSSTGKYEFNKAGNANATILNEGSIKVQTSGVAALVAPGVRNSGMITAVSGKVNLAAGEAFTIDLAGDGLVNLKVDPVSLGLSKNVTNAVVNVSAGAAEAVLDNVINTGSIQSAEAVNIVGGAVVLGNSLQGQHINIRAGSGGIAGVAGATVAASNNHSANVNMVSVGDINVNKVTANAKYIADSTTKLRSDGFTRASVNLQTAGNINVNTIEANSETVGKGGPKQYTDPNTNARVLAKAEVTLKAGVDESGARVANKDVNVGNLKATSRTATTVTIDSDAKTNLDVDSGGNVNLNDVILTSTAEADTSVVENDPTLPKKDKKFTQSTVDAKINAAGDVNLTEGINTTSTASTKGKSYNNVTALNTVVVNAGGDINTADAVNIKANASGNRGTSSELQAVNTTAALAMNAQGNVNAGAPIDVAAVNALSGDGFKSSSANATAAFASVAGTVNLDDVKTLADAGPANAVGVNNANSSILVDSNNDVNLNGDLFAHAIGTKSADVVNALVSVDAPSVANLVYGAGAADPRSVAENRTGQSAQAEAHTGVDEEVVGNNTARVELPGAPIVTPPAPSGTPDLDILNNTYISPLERFLISLRDAGLGNFLNQREYVINLASLDLSLLSEGGLPQNVSAANLGALNPAAGGEEDENSNVSLTNSYLGNVWNTQSF